MRGGRELTAGTKNTLIQTLLVASELCAGFIAKFTASNITTTTMMMMITQ